MKILCVDDEPEIIALLAEFLQLSGKRVGTAANGRQALELYHADPNGFQAIITDARMPEMGGLELLRALREQRFEVPVVVASGQNDGSIEEAVASYRNVAVLPKPFDLMNVLATLNGLLA
ncbi:MAG: response regulator [Desulfobulbaceae bacterium]|nr:response regulator [Desulfobulbaceae bacterium]